MKLEKPLPHSQKMIFALQRARSTSDAIVAALPGSYDSDRATVLLLAYTLQALQHMQAILALVDEGTSPGSALTLFRPLADTILRAQWLKTCASPQEIDSFVSDTHYQFPGFKKLADSLDAEHGLDGFFDPLKKSYATMCDYTHSGYEQISRHFSDRGIGPAYDEQMMINLVSESEKITLFHAIFFCRAVDRPEIAVVLSRIAASFPVVTDDEAGS